ncbi:MAG: hypothetical protein EZS28_041723, partial [Streblomastix strix]
MSHGHDAFRTRRGIKKLIDSTQKRQISPPPFHRTQSSSPSQSPKSSSPSYYPQQQQLKSRSSSSSPQPNSFQLLLQQSSSGIYPMWTTVDGDGTVPCNSAANDGMRADARFEIRSQDHMKLLFDPRVLNIIAAIFNFWKQDEQLKKDSFKPYKCEYINEYEKLIKETDKQAKILMKKQSQELKIQQKAEKLMEKKIQQEIEKEEEELIKNHAICALSRQTMKNPQLAPDGKVYEYSVIVEYLNNNKGRLPSNTKCDITQLKPDKFAFFTSSGFALGNPSH